MATTGDTPNISNTAVIGITVAIVVVIIVAVVYYLYTKGAFHKVITSAPSTAVPSTIAPSTVVPSAVAPIAAPIVAPAAPSWTALSTLSGGTVGGVNLTNYEMQLSSSTATVAGLGIGSNYGMMTSLGTVLGSMKAPPLVDADTSSSIFLSFQSAIQSNNAAAISQLNTLAAQGASTPNSVVILPGNTSSTVQIAFNDSNCLLASCSGCTPETSSMEQVSVIGYGQPIPSGVSVNWTPVQNSGGTYSFQTPSGMYLNVCSNCSQSGSTAVTNIVDASGTAVNPNTQFTMLNLTQLMNQLMSSPAFIAAMTPPSVPSTLPMPTSGIYHLVSDISTFVGWTEKPPFIDADSHTPTPWTLNIDSNGIATFQASNGQYLAPCTSCTGETSSKMQAALSSVPAKWKIVPQTNGYNILTSSGAYLSRCNGCAPGVTNVIDTHGNSSEFWNLFQLFQVGTIPAGQSFSVGGRGRGPRFQKFETCKAVGW